MWRMSITVPIYKKGDKTDCTNYRVLSLLPTPYKILSNILVSRLTAYAENIGDRQCVFQRNRSTADHILCIGQIAERIRNTVKRCISCLQTARRLLIKLSGRSCVLLPLSLASHKIGKEIKNVSE